MSLRLRWLSGFFRHAVRPLLARADSPRLARLTLDLSTRAFLRYPKGVPVGRRRLGLIEGLEIGPPLTAGQGVILYLHGGGYVAGSPATHRVLLAHLSRLTGLTVIAPDYRLAPEHPFPAAFDDALAAWRALVDGGIAPGDVIFGGDSAGGGLSLALLAHVVGDGIRPAGAFALSPWTDLTCSGASLIENEAADCLLPGRRIGELCEMVLGESAAADPRISPLFAGFDGAPPVFFQVGDTEILRDDTLRLTDRMRASGVTVTLDRWPDAPHVLAMYSGWAPEVAEAQERIAAFCRSCLSRPGPRGES